LLGGAVGVAVAAVEVVAEGLQFVGDAEVRMMAEVRPEEPDADERGQAEDEDGRLPQAAQVRTRPGGRDGFRGRFGKGNGVHIRASCRTVSRRKRVAARLRVFRQADAVARCLSQIRLVVSRPLSRERRGGSDTLILETDANSPAGTTRMRNYLIYGANGYTAALIAREAVARGQRRSSRAATPTP